MKIIFLFFFLPSLLFSQSSIRFAVIGDYGLAGNNERDVATLVQSWNPDFVITTGDNNYEGGASTTIDANIGQYYHSFISPYTGSYGSGDTVNRFFPCLGNHDWNTSGAIPYLNYFHLPNNERYYDFVKGPVHFFSIDSDIHEPDGYRDTSKQGRWLHGKVDSSTAPWKIVYFHHPPYTSGSTHGSTTALRWDFKGWGASIVLCGHEHIYERLEENGFPYIINGLGGKSLYPLGSAISGSKIRYNSNYGAQLVEANNDSIKFKFITKANVVIDSFTLYKNLTGIKNEPTPVPLDFHLSQNFPNPFNPVTVISYQLSVSSYVTLKVYTMLGVEVATLVNSHHSPGVYEATWDATNYANGMYFYTLQSGGNTITKGMLLMK